MWLLGSKEPFDTNRLKNLSQNKIAFDDIKEIYDGPVDGSLADIVGDKDALVKTFGNFPAIVDDKPRSEYYLLRHATTNFPFLVNDQAKSFVNKIRANYHTSL